MTGRHRREKTTLGKIKDRGYMEYSLSIMLVLITVILILFGYRISVIRHTKNVVEDALAASNLAAAVVDLTKFSETNELVISDCTGAYDKFQKALKENLHLTEDFKADNSMLISGIVTIHSFTIYNIVGNDITETSVDAYGNQSTRLYSGSKGHMHTPDGKTITSPTIYSKIGFAIKGYWGQEYYVNKENSVDIVKNNE